MSIQKIKIKYYNVDESNKYVILSGKNTIDDYVVRLFDYSALDATGDFYKTNGGKTLDKYLGNLKDKSLNNIENSTISYAKNLATANLTKMALGNIYGIDALEILTQVAQGNVTQSAITIKNKIIQGAGSSINNTQQTNNLGNDINTNPPSKSLANKQESSNKKSNVYE